MKILKIEFQNINSLKGTHEIDFTRPPFSTASLFAITGPTGSGKSTLLDVIALALYNQIPRLMTGKKSISNSILEKSGAIITRNQREAFARVTYESKKGTFLSQWSISTARTGNLRDYEMQVFDLSTRKAFDLNRSQVPAKNEELIGLNYDQFIKSVLLAQGEFAHFLKARKEDRGALLEQITGTEIYREISIMAHRKFREEHTEIDEISRTLQLLQEELLQEDILSKLKQELLSKQNDCFPLKEIIRALEKNLELRVEISRQERQIKQHQLEKEKISGELSSFEQTHGKPMKHHEQLQPLAEHLRTWKHLHTSAVEREKELSEQLTETEEIRESRRSCLKKITAFSRKEPEEQNVEAHLHQFEESVRQLQVRREDKLRKYRELETQFGLEIRGLEFQLGQNLKEDLERLRKIAAQLEERTKGLRTDLNQVTLDDIPGEKQRLRSQCDHLRDARQDARERNVLMSETTALGKEVNQLLTQLEELPPKNQAAANQAALLEERLEKLEAKKELQILKAELATHRHALQSGEPCPLCGALEHPYAHDLPEKEPGLEPEILGVRKELDRKKAELAGLKTSLRHFEDRLKEVREILGTKEKRLEALSEKFETRYAHWMSPGEPDWDELLSQQLDLCEKLDRFETEQQKLTAVKAGIPVLETLIATQAEGKEIKTALDRLYTGTNISADCRDLLKSWRDLDYRQQSLATAIKQTRKKLERIQADMTAWEEKLLPELRAAGCGDMSEALERLLPESRYLDLRRTKERLSTESEKLLATLGTLTTQLEELRKNDAKAATEELEENCHLRKQELKELEDKCQEMERKIKNDKERRERIMVLEQDLEEKKTRVRPWKILNELIGHSNGKKFNDFAQELTLGHLIRLANRRLHDLSDRYQLDKPTEQEDDSLVAVDAHMGGQRRSVKTLSGGETFLLSLSMALGLSDLASRNVEINSLFIDEGFGTLDPETLDQTLDTLEKLQAESSKTIGIISHVESLKERIATQIRLNRNGQGYSSLEIKG